jgi:hypothetical protein
LFARKSRNDAYRNLRKGTGLKSAKNYHLTCCKEGPDCEGEYKKGDYTKRTKYIEVTTVLQKKRFAEKNSKREAILRNITKEEVEK